MSDQQRVAAMIHRVYVATGHTVADAVAAYVLKLADESARQAAEEMRRHAAMRIRAMDWKETEFSAIARVEAAILALPLPADLGERK